MANGIVVFWDGENRADLIVPPSLKGTTKGLCGTFDGNQDTDFTTREGVVERNKYAFGNSWKTDDRWVCGF